MGCSYIQPITCGHSSLLISFMSWRRGRHPQQYVQFVPI
jgi:hypothetical protein